MTYALMSAIAGNALVLFLIVDKRHVVLTRRCAG